ncbi:MAG: hypothetical protein QM538_03345 [Methylacidiphilales bacterium]|nr:hypothetical protein [Candidatus Methylacidiphilales bacterium]
MKSALVLLNALCIFSTQINAETMDRLNDEFPALYKNNAQLSAQAIITKAWDKSGGDAWRKASSLYLTGRAIFYKDGSEIIYDNYSMWRVYEDAKPDAHRADGRVRIEGKRNSKLVFLNTFDGKTTYDTQGPISDQSANEQWASNFGFGAIRNALDPGWQQKRLPDDLIDGIPSYLVELTDPSGGITRFGIAQKDFNIIYVGFKTPRGYHERRYSNFFSKPNQSWLQPARVRLYYDGIKYNEVIWTDFTINQQFPEELFKVLK